MRKVIPLTAPELRAIATACEHLKTVGVDIEKYEANLTEDLGNYHFCITAINKKKGFRGALPNLPEFTLVIEKNTGQIIEKFFTR